MRIYGLGQGGWTKPPSWIPSGHRGVVPLERNGQELDLQQTKFHVTIPFKLCCLDCQRWSDLWLPLEHAWSWEGDRGRGWYWWDALDGGGELRG